MKIEIELQELLALQNEVVNLRKEVLALQELLNNKSEEGLKRSAIDLSWRLFYDYLSVTFERLGFEQGFSTTIEKPDNLEHFFGDSWYDNKRIEFQLAANVIGEWQNAFLRIGVIPKSKVMEVGKHLTKIDTP